MQSSVFLTDIVGSGPNENQGDVNRANFHDSDAGAYSFGFANIEFGELLADIRSNFVRQLRWV
jgi:hypothetical protein